MIQYFFRRAVSFAVLVVFVVFIFSLAIGREVTRQLTDPFGPGSDVEAEIPDLSQYITLGSLSATQLSLDDPDRRAILVGDIHGMSGALEALLEKASFDPAKDMLIHLGDVSAKGTQSGSISVLSYMTTYNVTGVRGNHDQKVIEWRAWVDWIKSLGRGTGALWLDDIDTKWEAARQDPMMDEEQWVARQKKAQEGQETWWDRVPEGWQMFSDHYKIARKMTKAEYEYLRALPLVLHLPSEHTFLVHAGLLPFDPTRSITNARQPLAHAPAVLPGASTIRARRDATSDLRQMQELAILTDVEQNKDPWVVLNMRNVLKSRRVSRKTHAGTPWTDLWNSVMPRCSGFHNSAKDSLPCLASTVIYGHAHARGLDIKRWTIGLDSGCVYGRRLTALILDVSHRRRSNSSVAAVYSANGSDDTDDSNTPHMISFGDNGQAQLINVKCYEHVDPQLRQGAFGADYTELL